MQHLQAVIGVSNSKPLRFCFDKQESEPYPRTLMSDRPTHSSHTLIFISCYTLFFNTSKLAGCGLWVVCPTFEYVDKVRSLAYKNKSVKKALNFYITITACRCCIGVMVCRVILPEFTCLFFKTLHVQGLVGPSKVCITSNVTL